MELPIYVTEMDENGVVAEQYEMKNNEECWQRFRERYISSIPEIALEMSSSGKYVAGLLRDMGFSIHIADPVKLALIFNTSKKHPIISFLT